MNYIGITLLRFKRFEGIVCLAWIVKISLVIALFSFVSLYGNTTWNVKSMIYNPRERCFQSWGLTGTNIDWWSPTGHQTLNPIMKGHLNITYYPSTRRDWCWGLTGGVMQTGESTMCNLCTNQASFGTLILFIGYHIFSSSLTIWADS